MEKPDMIIEVGNARWEVALYENPSARALRAALPQTISMDRWGDEFYGRLPARLPDHDEQRDLYEIGEVAFWQPGNAFCIFFGPTPASHGNEPRMASPGVPLGKIVKGDPLMFKNLGLSIGKVSLLPAHEGC
ncbi:hypothetical protein SAMN05660284_02130 [Formivibrio citricus]|uniref:Cyclophilin TM1367-like domain-containing protein n=1 Tax=Formivibrio citricus TaxID=83765 RepID=A0A1I5BB92_9NEIS|nr:cyclophilin-like fold protein [Formivibrio citricus]SFN71957.1 hypothetical protein SAMN05660284_02130 [Formivibrio citricus]